MKDKDLKDMAKAISKIKPGEDKIKTLTEEIDKRGLKEKTEKIGKEYGKKLEAFAKENDVKNMSKEDKAKLILEYKNALSPSEKQKFDRIMKVAKEYAKKKTNKER